MDFLNCLFIFWLRRVFVAPHGPSLPTLPSNCRVQAAHCSDFLAMDHGPQVSGFQKLWRTILAALWHVEYSCPLHWQVDLNHWTTRGLLIDGFLTNCYCFCQHHLISWLQSPSSVILEPKKIKSLTVSVVSLSVCHEVMGPDTMILVS